MDLASARTWKGSRCQQHAKHWLSALSWTDLNLEGVVLASNLHNLAVGARFSKGLEGVALPNSMQTFCNAILSYAS